MFRLTRYLKPYWFQFTAGSLAKLAEAGLELLLPLIMADLIDIGIKSGESGLILSYGSKMLGFSLLGFLLASLCQYYASVTSQGVGTVIRHELIQKIGGFSYKNLDRFGTPTLITRVTNDTNQIQQAVAMFIRLVTRAPFLCIGALIMAVRVSPKLSVIFVLIIPLFSIVLFTLMRLNIPRYKKAQKQLDRVSLVFRENLSGVRVIRAFSRHRKEKARMQAETKALQKEYKVIAHVSALLNPLTSLILNGGIILILWLGGQQVDTGTLTRGELLALINYASQILLTLIIVSNLVVLYTKASASANRINEVFDTKSELSFPDSPPQEKADAPAVAFHGVSLAYHRGENALEDISFSVFKGQTLGITGTTGSGKTSAINLIPRFYDAASGSVIVNGVNVKDYPKDTLLKKIAIVPQSSTLFSGSIADNLKIGNPHATREDMERALMLSQSLPFVKNMPNGLDSIIFEGGKNLSGGQKQRLAIARALVRDPEILILDDSLSALDYKTDKDLRAALKSLSGMTVIIVSQRLSSVYTADKILVLDDGRMAGLGTHEEVMEACPVYKEMWASQQGG